jgi:hypothetical protein
LLCPPAPTVGVELNVTVRGAAVGELSPPPLCVFQRAMPPTTTLTRAARPVRIPGRVVQKARKLALRSWSAGIATGSS